MPKFLRYIEGYHDQEIEQAIGEASAIHLLPMYQYYATPLRTGGCAKLNVCFKRRPSQGTPVLMLNIATIEWIFDLNAFLLLPADQKPSYVLDALHKAVLSAGTHFRWPLQRARDAYAKIVEKNLRFQFVWKKLKASPNRKLRIQIEVDFTNTVRLEAVFVNNQGQTILRKLFSVVGPGFGPVEFVLGAIEWIDNSSVKITHENGRDYWICRNDGTLDFFYPRAEKDAHGMFDLGRMYWEGQYVLRNPELGRQFIELAAQKGYHHAIEYLGKFVHS